MLSHESTVCEVSQFRIDRHHISRVHYPRRFDSHRQQSDVGSRHAHTGPANSYNHADSYNHTDKRSPAFTVDHARTHQ